MEVYEDIIVTPIHYYITTQFFTNTKITFAELISFCVCKIYVYIERLDYIYAGGTFVGFLAKFGWIYLHSICIST